LGEVAPPNPLLLLLLLHGYAQLLLLKRVLRNHAAKHHTAH
jgi:hypothetical protein